MSRFRPLPRLALPLLAYKLLLLLSVYFCARLLPLAFNLPTYMGNFHWPPVPAALMPLHFKTWDAGHYLYLSEVGYRAADESIRFFPLWPLLIRCGAWLFSSHLQSGLIMSNVLSALGILAFHDFAFRRHGKEVADLSTLALLAFPGALFLSFPYSESLFFLLCVMFLDSFFREHSLGIAATAFLLPLTRAVGIVILVPIFYGAVRAWHREKRLSWGWILCLAAPLMGAGAYLLFMRAVTGSALWYLRSFAELNLMGDANLSKLLDLPRFLKTMLAVGSFHDPLDSSLDRLFFLAFILACVRLWKTDKAYFFFALPMGLVPAMSVSFCGYTRFIIAAVPVFIAAGQALSGEGRKGWRWLTLSMLFGLQAILLFRHANNNWAG